MTALSLPVSRVLLGVCGSVAAAHAPAYVLGLHEMCGLDVRVVMTHAARAFVTPKALAVVSHQQVLTGWSDDATPQIDHVELATWAELILVMPATADMLGTAAAGLAPDLLSSCLLAAEQPVVFVPSMNHVMWRSAAVQRNVATLRADGRGVVPPRPSTSLSNGTSGAGALPALPQLVAWLGQWLDDADAREPRTTTELGCHVT